MTRKQDTPDWMCKPCRCRFRHWPLSKPFLACPRCIRAHKNWVALGGPLENIAWMIAVPFGPMSRTGRKKEAAR